MRVKSQSYRPCASCKKVRAETGSSKCKYERACSQFDPRLIELTGVKDLEELERMGQKIALGHVRASSLCVSSPLPEDADAFLNWLLDAHHLIFAEGVPAIAGHFRKGTERVFYGGERQHRREGVAAFKIDAELRKLYQRHQERSSRMPLAQVMAYFLEEFFRVHPFIDGNGRVGRLFLMLLAEHAGFAFTPKTNSRDRQRYVKALQYAHARCDPVSERAEVKNPVHPLERWIEKGLIRVEEEDF